MKIGITGHQERGGIDWEWVRSHLKQLLSIEVEPLIGYSSLAAGSDQVFAEEVINRGGQLKAILPIDNYFSYFEEEAQSNYFRLLALADVVQLRSKLDAEHAFFEAGKWIVREVDQLLAVWDGKPAEGVGGTADVVRYAIVRHKPTIHLNPCEKKISRI